MKAEYADQEKKELKKGQNALLFDPRVIKSSYMQLFNI